jgi:Fe2+ or Zn2+ uptake regulation protein
MPRLFIGNFDFEHRLAAPGRQLPAKLQRLNAELATSWLAIADDGDYLWTPELIEGSFFEQAVASGLPKVIPVVSFDAVPSRVECVPWGWTDDIRQLCDRHGWICNDPHDHAVRAANSRRLSSELEQEWRVGLPFSGEVISFEQIERYLALQDKGARWVIKAEFGMSGRERLLGSGIPVGADRSWIDKRLNANGIVFFEPWVKNVTEVGIQIDVPRQGEPVLLEVVPMIADERGQYCGSRLPSLVTEQTHVVLRPSDWGLAIDIALQAARRVQDLGYFGPLGIDAMQFQDENEQLHVRPLQDINARWTMGRLSLGFRKLLKPRESAEWLHGPSNIDSLAAIRGVIELLRRFLETKGMRLTREHELVTDAVFKGTGGFDADHLAELLQQDRFSRSTVFRTLSHLEEANLICVIPAIDGRTLYLPPQTVQGHRLPTSPALVGNHAAVHHSVLRIHP